MKMWQIICSFGIIAAIIFLIIIFVKPESSIVILTGINLLLVFGYVVATFEMIKVNKSNINLLKSPVLSAIIEFANKSESDIIKRINNIRLRITNHTNNNARDVRMKITALVIDRIFVASAPFDGSESICVQADHTYTYQFDMENEFLSRAHLTIQEMIRLANQANRRSQLKIEVQLSYLDGFGDKIDNPKVSWFFDFISTAWNFIG